MHSSCFTEHLLCTRHSVLDANKNHLPPPSAKLLGKDPGRPGWMGFGAHVSAETFQLPILFGGGDRDGSVLEGAMKDLSSWEHNLRLLLSPPSSHRPLGTLLE